MSFISWAKRRFGLRTDKPSDSAIDESSTGRNDIEGQNIDSSILSNILVRAGDDAERDKVLTTTKVLWHLWVDDENRNILRAMVMVESTYPHLAKMAELKPMSAEWITELGLATGKTTEGLDELHKAQSQLMEFFEELQKRDK